MRCYIDVDDTLAHFRQHAISEGVPSWSGTWYTTSRDNWSDEQKFIQDRTNALMRLRGFWEALPVWEGAHELIAAASFQGPVFLLTATPSSLAGEPEVVDMIRRAKVQWAWQNLHVPPERVVVCARADKIRYAFDPFANHANLLIDDAEQNCAEWREAGGEAHHFVNMPFAINFVKCL